MATTQIDHARQRIITAKIQAAAAAEGVTPEFIRAGIASDARTAVKYGADAIMDLSTGGPMIPQGPMAYALS